METKWKQSTISLVLAIALILQLTACGLAHTAKKVTDSAVSATLNTAERVSTAVSNWYKSIDLQKFKDGWDNAVGYIGSAYAATLSSNYVASIGTSINEFKTSMNSAYGSARGIAQEAGFAAEKWAAGTFNIDAAVHESPYHAEVVGSNELGSVDVTTNYGENASLKYFQTANGSAKAQATSLIEAYRNYASSSSNPKSLSEYMDSKGYDASTQDELLASIYEGQTRIIPPEQIPEAIEFLQGRITELSKIDGDVAAARMKAYQETLSNLKSRLEAPDGTTSKPASYNEMQAIAEFSQKGEFKPEDFGFSVSQEIPAKYVVKQAIGTGLDAGLLRLVLTVGPDIASVLIDAVKAGDLDEDELKDVGIEGAIAFSEGFVEGSVSRVVVTLCESGALGEALKGASPNLIATLVFLTIEAMIAGYSFAKGEISADEYGCLMADKILLSALMLPVTAALAPLLLISKPVFMIGCLAGGLVASVGYSLAKEAVLEFADGGGFEAIVPKGVASSIESAKAAISNLNLSESLSNLEEFAVSTASDGFIRIKGVLKV